MMSWTPRAIAAVVVTGALLVTGGSVALATGPEPAGEQTGEQVDLLCERKLPRMEARAARLAERITGDAGTRGSAEWLRARADRERAAGRETSAELLAERADRRAGRVDELNELAGEVAGLRTEHCGPK